MRLEVAIAGVALADSAGTPPGAPSVYATMRRLHPNLQPQRLKKSTLLAVSWAIEDECCSRAEQPMIFGGFQQERYYRAAEERWTELARIARSTMVFAAFSQEPDPVDRTTMVDLPEDAPMRREWVVVCDARDYPAMLTAWELPGQSTVPDRLRLFEAIWTVEPGAVRDAARACAQVAQQLGHPEGGAAALRAGRQPRPAAGGTAAGNLVAEPSRGVRRPSPLTPARASCNPGCMAAWTAYGSRVALTWHARAGHRRVGRGSRGVVGPAA